MRFNPTWRFLRWSSMTLTDAQTLFRGPYLHPSLLCCLRCQFPQPLTLCKTLSLDLIFTHSGHDFLTQRALHKNHFPKMKYTMFLESRKFL